MRRDPRTLLELRRLAYRVPRDPTARYVLADALLETAPAVFERLIESAHTEDERSGFEQLVWFRPKRMYPYQAKTEFGWPKKRTRWNPVNWFYTSAGQVGRTLDIERAHMLRHAFERRVDERRVDTPKTDWHVIVYRTQGKL